MVVLACPRSLFAQPNVHCKDRDWLTVVSTVSLLHKGVCPGSSRLEPSAAFMPPRNRQIDFSKMESIKRNLVFHDFWKLVYLNGT